MEQGSEPAPTSGGGPATREAKKAVVRAYLAACDQGDMAKIDATLAPDAAWWILSRQHFDRNTIMAVNQKRFSAEGHRQTQILGVAVDGDRVAIEYETAAPHNGAMGYNIHHDLFIVRNGAIVSGREYLNPPDPYPHPFKESQAAIFTRVPTVDASPEVEAHTRAVVTSFIGDRKLDKDLRAPDFRWWLTGVGHHDLDQYLHNLSQLMAAQPKTGPVVMDRTKTIGITVEGNRAAIEVDRNLIFADRDYLTGFHLLFVLKDGKIAEMHEHMDVSGAVRGGLPVFDAINMEKA
jgi:ketosteroid isomerase-like protein